MNVSESQLNMTMLRKLMQVQNDQHIMCNGHSSHLSDSEQIMSSFACGEIGNH